jgi:hypothetical protein
MKSFALSIQSLIGPPPPSPGPFTIPGRDGVATASTLRLWHTAGVFVSLSTAASSDTGTFITRLAFAILFALAFWFFLRWAREKASRGRRERYVEEDRRMQERLDRLDEEGRDSQQPGNNHRDSRS